MESNNNTTPGSATRKRRSTASASLKSDIEPASAKKRQTSSTKRAKGKQEEGQNTSRINLDGSEDPFDFAANSDHHPEPLKNINIERSSFGEVKYTKSLPSSADRYRNIERIAIGRNPQLCTSTSAATPDNPTSLSMLSSNSLRMELSTNKVSHSDKESQRKSDRKVTKDYETIDEFQIEMDDDNLKTPKSKKRSSAATTRSPKNASQGRIETPKSATDQADYWPTITVNTKKMQKDKEYYQIPELNPNEQLIIDHPKDLNQFLPSGARVLALWGNEYYAAIICGREAIGRYYVHFAEDNLNRILPPTGVIPISVLEQGIKISYIDIVKNEEVGKVSELISQPDVHNPENWALGEFQLRELDEDLNPGEIKKIQWQKLFLTKDQAGQILHGKKSNPVLKIDQENIINESRATRRSRSARASQGSGFETPVNSNSTKNFDSPSTTGRGRRRNTPKEIAIKMEIIEKQMNSQNKAEIASMDLGKQEIMNIKNEKDDTESPKTITDEADTAKSSIIQLTIIGDNLQNGKIEHIETVASVEDNKNIFAGLSFCLTSANRPNKKSEFNKREIRGKIEDRGGVVIEDFSSLEFGQSRKFRLIADTFYRTHKYLLALSLSIPCVNYKWIEQCVIQNKLEPIEEFLLPSGESTIEPGRIFEWKPKSDLFKGKKVLVYSKYSDDPKICSYGEIWTPIMQNLGATVIGQEVHEPFSKEASNDATMTDKIEFCSRDENKFDIFLADNDAEAELVLCAERNFGALAVSSEWIIQAIVTGELPDINASERFRYDFG